MKDIVPLEDWYYCFNAIIGTHPSGKRIRTSPMVARDGLIITTYNGSLYKLVSPVPTDEELASLDLIIKIQSTVISLPFPKKLYQTINHKLEFDLILSQWCVAKGTIVKLCQTTNFAVVIIPRNTLDKRTGVVIPTRVFSI
jgi:hypothetical protein